MVTFSLGMTVGMRKEGRKTYQYCTQAVANLRGVGFIEPLHLFVEPDATGHVPNEQTYDVYPHRNKKNRGCFRNFAHGLTWLTRFAPADWYFMIQDDCLWRDDAYKLMQQTCNDPQYADVGFLSPYTSKSMVPFGKVKGKAKKGLAPTGWVQHKFHNKAFWGAVCMVFPRQTAMELLAFPRFVKHRHHRKLDVVLGNCMRDMEKRGLVHVPSICEHIGQFSTLGRHRIRGNKWGRKGFGFTEKV